jgi:hypothetical protein
MGTHGYFFIGYPNLTEFLGYVALDGYPWEGSGYKTVIASRTETEFRHLATSFGLYPANVGKDYLKYSLNNFEYAYCWDGEKVQVLADGKPFEDDGTIEKWRQKVWNEHVGAIVAKNATVQTDHPGARLTEAIIEILDSDRNDAEKFDAIRSFCAGADLFFKK